MAMVGCVGGGEEAAFFIFAGQKYPIMRHKDVIEDNDAGRLTILA
jgi:hypothetical protein